MGSWPERVVSHTGIEILPRLLREAAVERHLQWAKSPTVRRRVDDEGLRVVKSCHRGENNPFLNRMGI